MSGERPRPLGTMVELEIWDGMLSGESHGEMAELATLLQQ
jgi:hypothetical protein